MSVSPDIPAIQLDCVDLDLLRKAISFQKLFIITGKVSHSLEGRFSRRQLFGRNILYYTDRLVVTLLLEGLGGGKGGGRVLALY